MHLYCYIRGIKRDVNDFVNNLQYLFFKYDFKVNSKPYAGVIQMGVREWGGFYELVFPQDSLQEVISTLTVGGRDPFSSYEGYVLKSGLFALRKLLKCEPLPEWDKTTIPRATVKSRYTDIRIIPIGIKKDKFGIAPMNHPITGEKVGEKEGEEL